MASLFVIQGRDQGTRFELEDSLIGLGRDRSNPICLHDTEVSRRHAQLHRRDNQFVLEDLGSANGTWVNGKRIRKEELVSGDRVQIGRSLFLFTGADDTSNVDLTEGIDISHDSEMSESQIVRSMSRQEGSQIFDFGQDDSESPWLARARSNLQVMYRTALAVSHTLDIDQLLNRIMELIFEWVEADRGCVMLVNPDSKQLEPRVRKIRKGVSSDDKITISKTILDYVCQRNEGVLTSDARDDDRWDPAASIVKLGIREAICVPMQGRYDVVGVIYVDTSTSSKQMIRQGTTNKFNEEHLKLMIAIGHQAALAVEDTSYYSAMVQAERMAAVGQTIATLSHHIKNILQGIRGGSYLIEMGLSEHDAVCEKESDGSQKTPPQKTPDVEALVKAISTMRKGWDIVEKNQGRITTLVMDMLTFSKEREPEMLPANLNEIVDDVVELMQSRAEELEVTIDWQPAKKMPQFTFDPEGIHRAVLNVVTNAIDACDKESQRRVKIQTHYSSKDRMIRILVEDNGSGIEPDDLDKIFTLFMSKKGGRGTGLGLPVSQKILNEHGGRIDVKSTLGVGSRFILELPAMPVEKSESSGQTIELKEISPSEQTVE